MRIYLIAFIVFCLLGAGITWYTLSRLEADQLISSPEGSLLQDVGTEAEPPGSLSELVVDESFDLSQLEQKDGHYLLTWEHLGKVDFEERFNDEINDYIYYPLFHPLLKSLDGKPIQIRGYIIPFEETLDDKVLILSAFPFSNCFFCGNAGPESVMDIKLKPGIRTPNFKQDQMTTFKGKLHLNDTDLYYLNYILEEAELVEVQ